MEDISKIATSIDNLSALISSSLDKINESSTESASDPSTLLSLKDELLSLTEITTSLNALRTQLNLLTLNDYEALYVANCISPLLQILSQLSSDSSFIMATVDLLNNSTTTKRKTAKLKKSEKTAYKILEQINCAYPILECRIYNFINNICRCDD
ncbi:hypothetical protein [Clostridium sp.]|uniref:hypothetical protein n=1 Tax=Clostridium sp. TaxID=1506 RepID=UPI003216A838